MSTKNNKNLATQALMDMEKITAAIKEESKKSLSLLLNEAVKNALRESCNEEDDKDYEVEDEMEDANSNENEQGVDSTEVEGDDTEVDTTNQFGDEAPENGAEEPAQEEPETSEEPEAEGDEWSEFSKYQVGDDTYDLTGENDYENVVKVYKLLKDEDQVVVHKDGNKLQLKDDSVGTEYVIDLGDDNGVDAEAEQGGDDFDSLNEEHWENGRLVGITKNDEFDPIFNLKRNGYIDSQDDEFDSMDGIGDMDDMDDMDDIDDDGDEIAGLPSKRREYEPTASDIADVEKWMDNFEDEDDFDDPIYESKMNNKSKKSRRPMKESKEVLFEVDLGYTDNYQAKDPIAGLSNNEPSKKGKSWHKGVPTGTAKPWAGETKSKGEPFEKTVNEEEMPDMGMEEPVEEATNVGGAVQQRTSSKSHVPAGRKEYSPKIKRHVSTAADYQETVAENKKLKAENKALKETLIALKGNLSEAYVTNVNLGKITKLFLENTTTQAEKIDIVNRFSNEAKTVEQSKVLYESIKRELNKPATTQVTVNESMSKANATVINENVYKSKDLLKSIDLMNRMGC